MYCLFFFVMDNVLFLYLLNYRTGKCSSLC